VVKIPSLSRRAETAPARDADRDGRIDEPEVQPVDGTTRTTGAQPVTTDPDQTTTYRSQAGGTATSPVDTDRPAADPTVTSARDRTPHVDRTPEVDRKPDVDRVPDADREPEVVAPAGPRPRASMLATLSLVFGVAAALFVLSGTLAGYGIALGVVALLLSVGGFSATGRRHVAGKTDAIIGLLLGLGAVLVGVLAMTGQFSWPNTDADLVQRFREWLDTQFVDRF
jgi:hypothetical protein